MCLDLEPYYEQDMTEIDMEDYPPYSFFKYTNPDDGHRYWVPKMNTHLLIYWNVEKFQEKDVDPLPSHYGPDNITWDDYEEVGMNFVKRGKPFEWGSIPAYGIGGFWFLDAHLSTYETSVADIKDLSRCRLGDPPAQEHMEWIRHQLWDTKMYGHAEEMGGIANTQLFASGRTAMLEMGPWNFGPVARAARFNWDLAPLPTGPQKYGGESRNKADSNGCAAWSGTPHPDAAWEVLKFLQSSTWHRGLARSSLKQPARLSVYPYYYQALRQFNPVFEDMNLEIMGEGVSKGLVWPETFFWPENDASLELLTPALQEIYVLGKKPTSYLIEIADQITELNRKAESG
jgi:ABC-type glycerol-3-phosphate transport system substrate-binding protein